MKKTILLFFLFNLGFFSVVFNIMNFNNIKDFFNSKLITTNSPKEIYNTNNIKNEDEGFEVYNNSQEIKVQNIYNGFIGENKFKNTISFLKNITTDNKDIITIHNEEIKKDVQIKKITEKNTFVDFFKLSTPLNKDEQKKYNKDSYLLIPKISIEAPILYPSIETKDIENIIMEMLKNGVVHRPETQLPHQKGNFFILGHSSNYPWIKSKYNNIFKDLDKLVVGDKIYIIYEERKYTYELTEKKIVNPNQIEVYNFIPGYNTSIMTCYPLGSDKYRLIGIFKLIY